jgi:hypothetical protein
MPADLVCQPILRRFISVGVVVVHLLTYVAAPYAADSAFWGERRRAVRDRFPPSTGESQILFAQLPKNLSMAGDLSSVFGTGSPPAALEFSGLGKSGGPVHRPPNF